MYYLNNKNLSWFICFFFLLKGHASSSSLCKSEIFRRLLDLNAKCPFNDDGYNYFFALWRDDANDHDDGEQARRFVQTKKWLKEKREKSR